MSSHFTSLAACVVLSCMSLASPALAAAPGVPSPSSRSTAVCGRDDHPETGMQGETPLADVQSGRNLSPYACGVRIVSALNPWNRGGNGLLARSGTCAYLTGSGPDHRGIAVIDVSDPRAPKAVGLLDGPGAIAASETMDLIDLPDRHILVAGDYGGGLNPPGPSPMDIYDITDCARPKHLKTFYWPANIHVPRITPDGKRIYAGRQFGTAGVLVMDISDLSSPKYMGDFPLILPGGRQQRCHDVSFNDAQTRMYCAGSVPTLENRKDDSAPSIWDISLVGKTNLGPQGAWPPIRFVGTSQTRGQGDHHAPLATINGTLYMVAANELRCTAFPRIFDITDETNLRAVGEFRLESNDRCMSDPAWAKANAIGNYGLHYNSVVEDAFGRVPLGMFSFMGSGLRVVDLRDPKHPREVAYYHPAGPPAGTVRTRGGATTQPATDSCMTHNYFIQETGQIWFACRDSGFHVAELSPAVRAYLGVPAKRRSR